METIEKLLKKEEELKEIRKEEQRIWGELREIAQEVTPAHLTELGYDKAQEIYKIVIRFLWEEREEELSAVLRELELAEHPESKGAIWYPDINEIPGLSLQEKHLLDEAVNRFRVGEFINLSCPLMQKTGIAKDQLRASAEFLTEKGVLKKYYHLGCQRCGEKALFDEETIQSILNEEDFIYCIECDDEMFSDKVALKAELESDPDTAYRIEKHPKDVTWRSVSH